MGTFLHSIQFKFEPAAWLSVIRLVIPMLQLFGWIDWTTDQLVSVIGSSEALLFLIQRSVVTPNAKLLPETVAQAQEVPPGPRP